MSQLEMFSPASFIPEPTIDKQPRAVKLRPYQEEALAKIEDYRQQGYNRQLLHLATGLGKTISAAEAMRRRGWPVLAMMHREELAYQAMAAIRTVWPEASVGLVKAENNQVGRDVTVSLVQTLSSEKRFREAFPASKLTQPHFIWTDEVHHGAASTYKFVYGQLGLLEKGGSNFHLGVTATPKRSDNKGLDDIFDVIAYSMGIRDGIVQGYLCDLKGHTLLFENEDMSDVKMVGDDYNQGQLDKAVRKVARNEAIVEAWLEQAKLPDETYRPTIGFGVGVQHAYELASAFSKAGIKSDVVHGQLEEDQRRGVLNRFSSGKIQVLWNVGVLTEGYDHPPTSCIIMARPTKSGVLYTQCIGRGTRLYPGKENCLILDVADVSSRNSLNQPVTLGKALGLVETDGKPKKEIESVSKQLKMKGFGGVEIDAQGVKGSKEFDPFSDPFAASELVGFRWHKSQAGLTLSLPKDANKQGNPQWLVIHRHPKTWLYDITLVTKIVHGQNGAGYNQYRYVEKFLNNNQFPSEELAAAWAGNWASKQIPGINRLADKNATWRVDQTARPTESQMNMLRKLYKSGPPPGYNAQTLSKGQASELIDIAIASKIKVNERPLSDLDLIS